jgi:hypothetical protein
MLLFEKNKILKERFIMAGKKKTPNSPINSNWGGKRSNQTGRPPKVAISQYQLDQMLAKAKRWAKKNKGMTVDDFLLMCIYGEVDEGWKLTMRERIACAKIWKEYTMARVQERNININDGVIGPEIYLPKEREDPAKIIPIDGGKK